ncbi:hypothetical protein H6G20_10995 [Desertifilum sp. FACHB-1129]|uniref:Uncharacterized protein n=1 Tax=Desertifilum tharense IPPAS B-1220 TaxID=1781255 RepID=A0ACD5GS54_9CYAN|nr:MULTISPECIES: hypothetical protein [Desertifilum]MCD8487703.1 hypothetical protein [Desertifilum sp.]MDA0211681.1 hypothetical protein [Cyanobacteria bacterium FC1]MBD2312188.1 hypothetical protein [Desertifilum sp. FACHB-1129]MBD2322150.1 hypothetical protein [Desertifilum sp. FACHB-866]MBD2332187.1 hypothetical protein [Desertifilum sp. FACHB-868]
MSYYDFDDHFWAPCEVCCQKRAETNLQPTHRLFPWIGLLVNTLKGLVVQA